jgi:HEPN domain-containing protein
MIDIPSQIAYWRQSAQEDWEVARHLVETGRTRHGLFFAHLALEKILKAHVCKHTQCVAPRMHNLKRLAGLAGLTLTPGRQDVLAEMNEFHIEGRYPERLPPPPSAEEGCKYIDRSEDVFQWLMSQS